MPHPCAIAPFQGRIGPLLSFLSSLLLFSGAVLPARETGPLWQRHTIDDTSQGADGVRLADLNGDGLQDIATGWEEGGQIRVYFNPGIEKVRKPWPRTTVGQVASPEDAVPVDLGGTGQFSIVSCCEGDNRQVFLHTSSAFQKPPTPETVWKTTPFPGLGIRSRWMFCCPLKRKHESVSDLLIGSKATRDDLGWLGVLECPPDAIDGHAFAWRPLRQMGWTMSLRYEDMDRDDDPDILFSDRRGERRGCYWLENEDWEAADYTRPWPEHLIGSTDKEAMFLDTGDLDGDGTQDLAVAISGHEIALHRAPRNSREPWSRRLLPLPAWAGTGKAVEIADWNLDGQADLAVTCEHSEDKSGVLWMEWKDTPWEGDWVVHDLSGPKEGVKFDRIEALDLDRDGDLDLLTCEERDNLGVIWYENPTVDP